MGGDVVALETEVIESEGDSIITLSAEGFVRVRSISVDGDLLQDGIDYTSEGSIVTFLPASGRNDPTVDGSRIIAIYNNAVYSDNDIVAFLEDAASDVAGDLTFYWEIGNGEINDVCNVLFPYNDNRIDHQVLRLLALKVGLNIRNDINNNAADDAISVRDGETSIDLSKSAQSGERVLSRSQRDYLSAMHRTATNRFRGLAAIETSYYHAQTTYLPTP